MADKKQKKDGDERNPEFERFEDFVKKIAAVPKEEVDERRREWERRREQEKQEREKKRAG